MQDCFLDGTKEAQKAAGAMWDCYEDNPIDHCLDHWCLEHAQSPDDCPEVQECVEQTLALCQDETYACFPPGTMNCFDMSLCVYTCPEGNNDCVEYCFGEGSIEATDQWNAIYYCLVDNGLEDCADGDDECLTLVFDACKEEQHACRSGEATCKEVWDCLDTCGPMDEVCTLECIWNGTGDAQDVYQALVDCGQAECGDEPAADCRGDVLEGACKDEFDACVDG